MTKTIVAMYDDIVVARQVVEDLVNADFARNSISLITNDANNQYSHYLDKNYTPRNDAVTGGEGASFGAVVGTLTGVLVGLAALVIPGIGLAIVAGPIVGGLTGVVAGAVAGGIVGALIKSGVPEDVAPYYAEGIRRGGTLISVQTSDTLRAEDIINRHGSINIHERSNQWRQDGWKGFDAAVESVANKGAVKAQPEMVTPVTTVTTSTKVTPPMQNAGPLTDIPPMFDVEPQIDKEDTAKLRSVTVTAPTFDTTDPVVPTSTATEPALVVVEKSPKVGYSDTAQ